MLWLSTGYFSYYIYMIPALVLVLIAQAVVKSRYRTFGKIATSRSLTGEQVARMILQQNDIIDVQVHPTSGQLSDNYNPGKKVIFLSEGVYASSSVAAVGIAAHEAGHAVQHASGYAPVKIRTFLVPVCNIASNLGLPLAIIGFFLNMFALVNVGLILFGTAALFQLVTLPVEFNASRRALSFLRHSGLLTDEEYAGVRKVLTAAAMTYVAALAQSVMQLLYFVLRFGRRRN